MLLFSKVSHLSKYVKISYLNESKHRIRFLDLLSRSKGILYSEFKPKNSELKRSFLVREELDNYIKRGNSLSLNPPQGLKNLDNLIKDFDKSETFTNLSSLIEYQNQGETENFFIVLAAPSMAGKTQIAFSVRSKRPLYFTLQTAQRININFEKLSSELVDAVIDDQENIIQYLIQKGLIFKLGERKTITLAVIRAFLGGFKLKSLGFLVHLIQDAESNFETSGTKEWMEFYTRNEDFNHVYNYEPLSIDDLKNIDGIQQAIHEKYFVFLDEFHSPTSQDYVKIKNLVSKEPESEKFIRGLVLMRNLCRLLKVPCVLASTNAQIANLVGQSARTGSGGSPLEVWCYVLPKYSYLSASEVEDELARKVSVREEERMKLLIKFLLSQCVKTRPGVAYIAFTTLRKITKRSKDLDYLTVDSIFTDFMMNITQEIYARKFDAFDSVMGLESNIRLISGTSFDQVYRRNDFKGGSIATNTHFYYLKNPRSNSDPNEAFLLFKRVSDRVSGSSLSFTAFPKDVYNVESYFDEGEELLKLACLFGNSNLTVKSILSQSFDKRTVKPIESPVASSKSGDALENLAFASIIDSSHYSDSTKILTFDGVSFKKFLINLLRNLNDSMDIDFNQNITLEFDDQSMNSIKVPCLYISNRDWISDFKEIFNKNESSFRLGTYCRTPNKSEIDASFDLVDADDNNALAVVECKNWTQSVGPKDYKLIIEKAINFTKLIKIESFIDVLRCDLIKPELLEEFQSFLKSLSVQKRKGQSKQSALVESFEDSKQLEEIKSTFIALENKAKFEELFESKLKNLNLSCPLIHFLFCDSFSKTSNLKLRFKDLKINIFKFVKSGANGYKMVSVNNSKIHSNPSIIGIIIETKEI